MKLSTLALLAFAGAALAAGCTDMPPTKPANDHYARHPDRGMEQTSESPSVPPAAGTQTEDHTPGKSGTPGATAVPPASQP